MSRLLHALCTALVLFFASGIAHAHGGYESETEVRLYPDRMRIVTRTSLPFAWRILGDRAPATSDPAGQAAAKPLLATAASSLFEVTAGGKPLAPVKTDAVFEVHDLHDHAAFILDYTRPAASPVVVKATFFPLLGELDDGTISVFDHSSSFQRDIEPLLKRSLSLQSPSITFDTSPPKEASPQSPPTSSSAPAAPAPAPAAPPALPASRWLAPLCLAVAIILAVLIRAIGRSHRPVE